MLEIVGAVLAATVRTNESLSVSAPSLTVTVMVDVPVTPVAGVTVTVRLPPEPPNTTFATGTSVVLLLAALNVRLPAAVSASSTVKPIAGVAVFSGVLRSVMSEIFGALLPAVTLSTNESLAVTRSYTYDETEVLAKAAEEQILREALAADLARRVMQRIQSLGVTAAVPPPR